MYLPQHFHEKDYSQVIELIDQNSFMTVISYPEDQPIYINHAPLILDPNDTSKKILIGHLARRNPQWTHFMNNPKATLIVHGPHTYITPTWYRSGRDVPTWNYAVAHLHGKITLLPEFKDQISVLEKLTNFFEKDFPTPWEFELPSDLEEESALTSAIISFQFEIEAIETKFKLSQNRSKEDHTGILDGLMKRGDEMSLAVHQLMHQKK